LVKRICVGNPTDFSNDEIKQILERDDINPTSKGILSAELLIRRDKPIVVLDPMEANM
jgi:hypothetical protein